LKSLAGNFLDSEKCRITARLIMNIHEFIKKTAILIFSSWLFIINIISVGHHHDHDSNHSETVQHGFSYNDCTHIIGYEPVFDLSTTTISNENHLCLLCLFIKIINKTRILFHNFFFEKISRIYQLPEYHFKKNLIPASSPIRSPPLMLLIQNWHIRGSNIFLLAVIDSFRQK